MVTLNKSLPTVNQTVCVIRVPPCVWWLYCPRGIWFNHKCWWPNDWLSFQEKLLSVTMDDQTFLLVTHSHLWFRLWRFICGCSFEKHAQSQQSSWWNNVRDFLYIFRNIKTSVDQTPRGGVICHHLVFWPAVNSFGSFVWRFFFTDQHGTLHAHPVALWRTRAAHWELLRTSTESFPCLRDEPVPELQRVGSGSPSGTALTHWFHPLDIVSVSLGLPYGPVSADSSQHVTTNMS